MYPWYDHASIFNLIVVLEVSLTIEGESASLLNRWECHGWTILKNNSLLHWFISSLLTLECVSKWLLPWFQTEVTLWVSNYSLLLLDYDSTALCTFCELILLVVTPRGYSLHYKLWWLLFLKEVKGFLWQPWTVDMKLITLLIRILHTL